MKVKVVSGIMLTLLLIGMLTLAFNIQLVKASGTIYIRADGSVEGTDKIQRDGDVYTFTDNIYDSIVVERDDIVVDGAGYTVQGTGFGIGIRLSNRNNVTLKNAEVTNFTLGISLFWSYNNTLIGNNASNNGFGIRLVSSWNNTITGNTASNTNWGIYLSSSNNNTLTGNTFSNNAGGIGIGLGASNSNILSGNTASNNDIGIYLDSSSNNIIYHNNFINNNRVNNYNSTNTWDDGYPSGGNYWSDYTGTDADGDGIGACMHASTCSRNGVADNDPRS